MKNQPSTINAAPCSDAEISSTKNTTGGQDTRNGNLNSDEELFLALNLLYGAHPGYNAPDMRFLDTIHKLLPRKRLPYMQDVYAIWSRYHSWWFNNFIKDVYENLNGHDNNQVP